MATSTIQVYVSTYAKYNSGSLKGAWVDLEQFSGDEEGFLEFIAELHNDETDPEYMFQDYEGFPSQFYSESSIDSRVFEWLELDENDREKVNAFLYCFGDTNDLFKAADNAYYGQADSDTEFAEELLESTGELQSIPEHLRYYFDFTSYASDLMISDFSQSNGFYFSNNW